MAFVEEGELSGPKWEHANRVSRNHFVLDRTDDRAGNPRCGAWMGSLTDGGGTDKTRKEKEAPPGFEPGMADLQSAALATWPRRRACFGEVRKTLPIGQAPPSCPIGTIVTVGQGGNRPSKRWNLSGLRNWFAVVPRPSSCRALLGHVSAEKTKATRCQRAAQDGRAVASFPLGGSTRQFQRGS